MIDDRYPTRFIEFYEPLDLDGMMSSTFSLPNLCKLYVLSGRPHNMVISDLLDVIVIVHVGVVWYVVCIVERRTKE